MASLKAQEFRIGGGTQRSHPVQPAGLQKDQTGSVQPWLVLKAISEGLELLLLPGAINLTIPPPLPLFYSSNSEVEAVLKGGGKFSLSQYTRPCLWREGIHRVVLRWDPILLLHCRAALKTVLLTAAEWSVLPDVYSVWPTPCSLWWRAQHSCPQEHEEFNLWPSGLECSRARAFPWLLFPGSEI